MKRREREQYSEEANCATTRIRSLGEGATTRIRSLGEGTTTMAESLGESATTRIRLLGEGAFSKVYLEQTADGLLVACKVSRNVTLLRREAEYLKGLQVQAFPDFYAYEETEGEGRLYMEYIKGFQPNIRAGETNAYSAKTLLEIAISVTETMMYLHERKTPLLYCDLKPENLLIEESGIVRIIDLGLLREEGVCNGILGTPGYAAPEQLGGETERFLTPKADIYGFGRTMLALMGGIEEMTKEARRLEQFLRTCCQEKTEERPADMRLVRDILLEIKNGEAKDTFSGNILSGRTMIQKNVITPKVKI